MKRRTLNRPLAILCPNCFRPVPVALAASRNFVCPNCKKPFAVYKRKAVPIVVKGGVRR